MTDETREVWIKGDAVGDVLRCEAASGRLEVVAVMDGTELVLRCKSFVVRSVKLLDEC